MSFRFQKRVCGHSPNPKRRCLSSPDEASTGGPTAPQRHYGRDRQSPPPGQVLRHRWFISNLSKYQPACHLNHTQRLRGRGNRHWLTHIPKPQSNEPPLALNKNIFKTLLFLSFVRSPNLRTQTRYHSWPIFSGFAFSKRLDASGALDGYAGLFLILGGV